MDKVKSVYRADELPRRTSSGYPPPHDKAVQGRANISLGDVFGLTQFGVRITELAPGAWSSHRHWHEQEDEFVYALEGEMVLVDDHGRHPFLPGMVAGFKANNGNGHHIINESGMPAKFLVVGTRAPEEVAHYSDIDLKVTVKDRVAKYTRKDGSGF